MDFLDTWIRLHPIPGPVDDYWTSLANESGPTVRVSAQRQWHSRLMLGSPLG